MSVLRYLPTKRVLAAALRLAALYAAGVTVLFVLAMLLDRPSGLMTTLQALPLVSIPVGICFAAAFLLLGVARRAGFTVLWLLMLALWAWGMFSARGDVLTPPERRFVPWTLLAAPLYAMVAIGFPSSESSAPRRRLIEWTVAVAWAALVVLSIEWSFPDMWSRGNWGWWRIVEAACLAMPPLLTLRALLRIYKWVPAEVSTIA